MGEGRDSGAGPLVAPGMRFSGVDDAVVEALNYPAMLQGRQDRQMRRVDLGGLHSRMNGAKLGFAVSLVDDRGRISSRHVFRLLNWLPGTKLGNSVGRNYVVLKAVPDGALVVDAKLRLGLPAGLLHYCDLKNGEHAFLVAVPDHNMLVVHPPFNLAEMIRGFHAEQLHRATGRKEGDVDRW